MTGDPSSSGLNNLPYWSSRPPVGLFIVPLDKIDLSLISVVYTLGDYAAVSPNFAYQAGLGGLPLSGSEEASSEEGREAVAEAMISAAESGGFFEQEAVKNLVISLKDVLQDASWRDVLRWVALPGFLVSLAVLTLLPEPRNQVKSPPLLSLASSASYPPSIMPSTFLSSRDSSDLTRLSDSEEGSGPASFIGLLKNPAFITTTFAAALNDVGSYALIAWQSTFYERVYHLEPQVYAPVLAAVLPIGGIIGGVGGGFVADRLAQAMPGGRAFVTAGASLLACPLILLSLLAPSQEESFAALLIGFSLSEGWRAPAAVMARSVAPSSMGASASALYLCVRNLVGGLGPLMVALLAQKLNGDLQSAMLLIPASYFVSGGLFLVAEGCFQRQIQKNIDLGKTVGGSIRRGSKSKAFK